MQYPSTVPLAEFQHLLDFVMGRSTLPKNQLLEDGWTCQGYVQGVVFPVTGGPAGAVMAVPQTASAATTQDFELFVHGLSHAHMGVAMGQPIPTFTIPPWLLDFIISLIKKLLGLP